MGLDALQKKLQRGAQEKKLASETLLVLLIGQHQDKKTSRVQIFVPTFRIGLEFTNRTTLDVGEFHLEAQHFRTSS
jgi:hypothetical protein